MAADSLSLISGRGVVIYQGKTDKSFIKSRSTTSIAGGGGGALFLSLSLSHCRLQSARCVWKKPRRKRRARGGVLHQRQTLLLFHKTLYIYIKRTKDARKILSLGALEEAPHPDCCCLCASGAHFVNTPCKHTHTHTGPNK